MTTLFIIYGRDDAADPWHPVFVTDKREECMSLCDGGNVFYEVREIAGEEKVIITNDEVEAHYA